MLNLPTVKLSTGLAQICNKVLWSTNEKFMCEWWMRTLHFVVKEGHCANSHWHYWCRQPNKTFFTEDIGTSIYWYLDYKLNFCEDTELIPSFYPQFQVKDRNALNVLLIFSLFDFWRKLTLFLSSLRRFYLRISESIIYIHTHICIAFGVELELKGLISTKKLSEVFTAKCNTFTIIH